MLYIIIELFHFSKTLFKVIKNNNMGFTFKTLVASALVMVSSRAFSLNTLRRSSSNFKMSAVNYKVGFMFPGQGAQVVGMAGPVCAELPAAKALFDKASRCVFFLNKYLLFTSCR